MGNNNVTRAESLRLDAIDIQRYTVTEASLITRQSRANIISAIKRGELTGIYTGARYLVEKKGIEKWMGVLMARGKKKLFKRKIEALYNFRRNPRGLALMAKYPRKREDYMLKCEQYKDEIEAYAREREARKRGVMGDNIQGCPPGSDGVAGNIQKPEPIDGEK